ncbi:MAG: tRNA-dihydrouridine synthase family protein [Phycisphaerales bacterium]
MSVEGGPISNNATSPTPAIAPGAEDIDVRRVAGLVGSGGWEWPGVGRTGGVQIDPRIRAAVPGFDAPFFQAGLAGYSDAAMRVVARRHGCPFCVTEALLDRTLLAGGRGFDKADLGELHDNVPGGAADHPLAGQIMGSGAREMAAAALKMVEQKARSDKEYRKIAYAGRGEAGGDGKQILRLPGGEVVGEFDPSEGLAGCGEESCDPLDYTVDDCPVEEPPSREEGPRAAGSPGSRPAFEVIDVNLACPVKKIEKKSRGGHWLTDPGGAIEILEAVRDALPSGVVCTVKMRRSFDDTPEMVENFHVIFDAAYRMGYAWATVHARTVEQKYVGPSRWTFLKDLRERHPDKVFFGSGDVWSAEDVFRMIAYAGVSGVSVARGCIGNPWLFRQAREMMGGAAPTRPSIAEQREVLREHFALSLSVTRRFRHGEDATSKMMRKFAIRFAQHHPRADDVRRDFIGVSSTQQWIGVLERWYR